jgi:uncharacterized membrane protein YqiK
VRDDRAESATSARAAEPTRALAHAIQQYEDALPLLAQHAIGDAKMDALDSAIDKWIPGVHGRDKVPAGGHVRSPLVAK